MKRFRFTATLLVALTCCGLNAETIWTHVPFDFHMGTVLMPAGEYLVSRAGNLVTLREQHGGKAAAAVLTVRTDSWRLSQTSVLRFNKYGMDYFLGEILLPDSYSALTVVKSPREQELARRMPLAQPTIVAVQTK